MRSGINMVNSTNALPALDRFLPDRIFTDVCEIAMKDYSICQPSASQLGEQPVSILRQYAALCKIVE